jgi:hypothetical protein
VKEHANRLLDVHEEMMMTRTTAGANLGVDLTLTSIFGRDLKSILEGLELAI